MKKTKFTLVISLLILICVFIVIGCESENEILPDYILDWVFEEGSNNILLKLDNEHWNHNNYFNNDSFVLISDKDSLLSTFNEQRVLLFSLDSACFTIIYEKRIDSFYKKHNLFTLENVVLFYRGECFKNNNLKY